MQPLDFFAGHLLKGTGDYGFLQNVAEHLRIIDILRALSYAEHRSLFRQM